ncbi:MAG: mandelate racemase/muconate lactonizing enzyme family protein, partial [Ideonella sp.]
MPKIQTVEFCAIRLPLDRVTSFSNRTVTARHYGLVKIRSTDGAQGIGFCYVGSAGGGIFTAAVEELLGPLLVGQESLAVEGLWQKMYQESLLQGRSGTVMRALSALDTALWDLNARSCGLPMHKYLGAVELESVPAYASGGYYLDGKSPQMLGEEMAGYVEKGFKAVKMKTGRLSPAEEEERVKAAREAIGPDVELMMDCNNGWADTTQAMRYIRRFEAYDPYFIEEP